MKGLMQKGLALGIGIAMMGKEQIEKVVEDLVAKGEIPVDESKNLVKDLIDKGAQQQQQLEITIREKVKAALTELDIASKKDLQLLEERIKKLENDQTETGNDR